ncbi:hypothetical protein HF1_04180 [Mycoplasma haemofelis str. Langford 1]|uniref:Uncharacterized protein n=1 Tax=Mycoplasma haemofelis (strain Langford 1) TaxID=941640 RepID=E8ZH05_MYCHL|nr:hypothetical protein [Mycoplasma haemofelis]CBY92426.1 hypothetical protein HF1_04180 [Mycoplasma haemofelis str. Langford 1]
MGLSKKAGFLSTASVGGVAGSAALAHHLLSEGEAKNIADKFRRQHFVPISKQSDWQAMLTKYTDNNVATGARFSANTNITWEELKSTCEQVAKGDVSDTDSSWKFNRWCVLPKTIKSHISSYGLTSLGLEASDTKNKDDFEKLRKSYLDRNMNSILDLKTKLNTGNTGEAWKELQSECKKLSDMESTNHEWDYSFENFKEWCTKEAADKLK